MRPNIVWSHTLWLSTWGTSWLRSCLSSAFWQSSSWGNPAFFCLTKPLSAASANSHSALPMIPQWRDAAGWPIQHFQSASGQFPGAWYGANRGWCCWGMVPRKVPRVFWREGDVAIIRQIATGDGAQWARLSWCPMRTTVPRREVFQVTCRKARYSYKSSGRLPFWL